MTNSLLSLFVVFILFKLSSGSCLFNSTCHYRTFGTKTGYNFARGDIRDVHTETQKQCKPIGLWLLTRHGTRYPGSEATQQMRSLSSWLRANILYDYEAGRSSLCAQDVDNLRTWFWDPSYIENASQLAQEGYSEMVYLGRRLQEKFPDLTAFHNYNEFHFQSSEEQRSVDSCTGVIEGIFGSNSGVQAETPSNAFLRPYRLCNRWMAEVYNNPSTEYNYNIYLNSTEMAKVINEIKLRTGFQGVLSAEDVQVISDLCEYEQSFYQDNLAPWCTLLTPEHLDILEYVDDLDNYYSSGPGNYLNSLIGAVLLRNLLENFKSIIEGDYARRFSGYCSHNSMMGMVYTALDLFKDVNPLTAWNRDPYRQWKSTKCANFATNLISVLYDCTNLGFNDYRVEFYQNEYLLDICPGGYCSWNAFETIFARYAGANLDFCEI